MSSFLLLSILLLSSMLLKLQFFLFAFCRITGFLARRSVKICHISITPSSGYENLALSNYFAFRLHCEKNDKTFTYIWLFNCHHSYLRCVFYCQNSKLYIVQFNNIVICHCGKLKTNLIIRVQRLRYHIFNTCDDENTGFSFPFKEI